MTVCFLSVVFNVVLVMKFLEAFCHTVEISVRLMPAVGFLEITDKIK